MSEQTGLRADCDVGALESYLLARVNEVYLADDRPWVVGFSGGKDSTALLQVVYRYLLDLPSHKRTKPVHVVASDTRVELPSVTDHVRQRLQEVERSAEADRIPLRCTVVSPAVNDTFWVNLIGRGYPPPTVQFRWCTERLKILPTTRFIQRVVSTAGAVNIFLGVRSGESSARAKSLAKHQTTGDSAFRPHSGLRNAWVVAPLHDLTTEQVWEYLLASPSPWGSDHRDLYALYLKAAGHEPELALDLSSPPAALGRFGCWTCTVVDEDQMTRGFVESGEARFRPLLSFRKYLLEMRSKPGARYDLRRNGLTPIHRETGEIMRSTGPFTHAARMAILEQLLRVQDGVGDVLIGSDELEAIQQVWDTEESRHPEKPAVSTRAVERIWTRIPQEGVRMADHEAGDVLSEEDQLLEDVCGRLDVRIEMMLKLRRLEEDYGRLRRRHGLPQAMRDLIREYVPEVEWGDD